MLNDILDRAADKAKAPTGLEPDVSRETPDSQEDVEAPESGQEKKPPQKNKPSSVYVYLAVLFGAAFLMLLLAYFVQQRNNESTISGLQNSWNLSREELMDENQRLTEENERLTTQKNLLEQRVEQVKEEKQSLTELSDILNIENSQMRNHVVIQNVLDLLERFTNTGDWLMAGTLIQHYDERFNDQNRSFFGEDTLPSQMEQYLALREKVLDRGVIQLEETASTGEPPLNSQKPSAETYQFPILRDFLEEGQEKDYTTAYNLAYVLVWYPQVPENAAYFAAIYFRTPESREALMSSENFQTETLELFQRVWDELVFQGELIEDQDGTVTARNNPEVYIPIP